SSTPPVTPTLATRVRQWRKSVTFPPGMPRIVPDGSDNISLQIDNLYCPGVGLSKPPVFGMSLAQRSPAVVSVAGHVACCQRLLSQNRNLRVADILTHH